MQSFHSTLAGFFMHLHSQAKYYLCQDALGQQLYTSHHIWQTSMALTFMMGTNLFLKLCHLLASTALLVPGW